MGLIGRILSFVRAQRNGAQISDVKTDPGGGPNVTAEHFAPAGDDAHPLPGDYVYGSPSPQHGRYAAVGYVDPANQSKAQPGEKRLYARNADGQQVGEVWLKADGTIVSENDNGTRPWPRTGRTTHRTPKGAPPWPPMGPLKHRTAAGR